MRSLLCFLALWSGAALAQYDEYKSYETFSELDRFERDYGLILMPSITYSTIEEDNAVSGATVSDRSRNLMFYDLRMGYIFRSGFYFGILYSGETQDINSGVPQNDRESVGLSFGYVRRGWVFTGTFFPYSKQTLANTTDVSTYSEGMGYQADAAYYFRLGRYFSVGPQLVYKSLSYGKAESATTSVNADATSQHTIFTPMISMIFNLYRG